MHRCYCIRIRVHRTDCCPKPECQLTRQLIIVKKIGQESAKRIVVRSGLLTENRVFGFGQQSASDKSPVTAEMLIFGMKKGIFTRFSASSYELCNVRKSLMDFMIRFLCPIGSMFRILVNSTSHISKTLLTDPREDE